MKELSNLVELLLNKWSIPKKVEVDGLPLICYFEEQNKYVDFNFLKYIIPPEIKEFWSKYEYALLYLDIRYNQWGLEILPLQVSVIETKSQHEYRESQFKNTDLVIGLFRGDSDVLFVSCDQKGDDFGVIYVATPIDRRPDWYQVGVNLIDFLNKLEEANGKKFWET